MDNVFPNHFEGRMFYLAIFPKVSDLLKSRLYQFKCEAYAGADVGDMVDVLCEDKDILEWLCRRHKGTCLGEYRGPQFWLNHDGRIV